MRSEPDHGRGVRGVRRTPRSGRAADAADPKTPGYRKNIIRGYSPRRADSRPAGVRVPPYPLKSRPGPPLSMSSPPARPVCAPRLDHRRPGPMEDAIRRIRQPRTHRDTSKTIETAESLPCNGPETPCKTT